MQHFNLDVLLFVGDLPARSKCCCINSCVGYYSCTQCLLPSRRCNDHQHTLYSWTEFRRHPPQRRTEKNISDCIRQVKLTSKFDKIFGIISRSPLSSVLSMPDQVPFDYFHLCFEIHTPLIMKHWMKFLSKECKQRIDQYLSHISYLIRSIDILKQSLIFLNGKRAK